MNDLMFNRKVFAAFLVSVFVVSALLIAVPVRANPGVLYVDDDSICGGNSPCYTTIGAGIVAASPDDTVKVYPGLYPEALIINKALTLEAARGQPKIQALGLVAEVIRIHASNVNVIGFLLQGDMGGFAIGWGDAAPISNVLVENNHIKGVVPFSPARPGIFGCGVDNMRVLRNTIQGTSGMGIFLGDVSSSACAVTNSVIEGNLIVDTVYTGIGIVRGSDNTIRGNDVHSAGTDMNLDDGIRLGIYATSNVVEGNRVSGSSRDGIRATVPATDNRIQNNKSVGNARYDIRDDQTTTCDNTWAGNKFNTSYGCATG